MPKTFRNNFLPGGATSAWKLAKCQERYFMGVHVWSQFSLVPEIWSCRKFHSRRGRCSSCDSICQLNAIWFLKCYERFKVHRNSNHYISGPEVDFGIIPTALITVCLVLKEFVRNFRQVAPQVPLLKTPKISNPLFSRFWPVTPLENFTDVRARVPLAMGEKTQFSGILKNVTVQKCKFSVGGPDPQMGGLCPQWTGALYRDPKGAHCSEKTVAIRTAVAEKIDFEEKNLAPSSGKTVQDGSPRLCTLVEVVEY